jgi:hypothetical protein
MLPAGGCRAGIQNWVEFMVLGFIYLLIVAIVTAIMGVVILARRISLVMRGVRAAGAFARWEVRGLRKKYYHPVIRFTAHDGEEYEFVGGPGRRKKVEGKSYKVIYPRNAPDKAMVYSFLSYWAAGAILGAIQAYHK